MSAALLALLDELLETWEEGTLDALLDEGRSAVEDAQSSVHAVSDALLPLPRPEDANLELRFDFLGKALSAGAMTEDAAGSLVSALREDVEKWLSAAHEAYLVVVDAKDELDTAVNRLSEYASVISSEK